MFSPYAAKGPGIRVMNEDNQVPAISMDGVRGGGPIAGGRFAQSNYSAFGANGELNASSKAEMMKMIGHVLKQASQNTHTRAAATVEQAEMRLAELKEAFHDRSGEKFQVLGEVISEEIWETLGREGFSRKLFAVQPVARGQTGRVKVRRKDVVAYQVTTDVKVQIGRAHV